MSGTPSSAIGLFQIGISPIGGFIPVLTNIFPMYPYRQYAEDDNIQAVFSSVNSMAQAYLAWFVNTPLAVYVSPNINGPLLDWIANGIYGISRPSYLSETSQNIAGISMHPIGVNAIDTAWIKISGTLQQGTDDLYKRSLTWFLYRNDGAVPNLLWLRRRIARFLYGANGADIAVDDVQLISLVSQPLSPPESPALSSSAGGTLLATTYYVLVNYVTATGETLPSVEASLAVAADYVLNIASPSPIAGAIGWNAFVSTSSGTEQLQNSSPIAIGTAWIEPTTGLISGSAPPTENTSVTSGEILAGLPDIPESAYFQQFSKNGVLPIPFQVSLVSYIL